MYLSELNYDEKHAFLGLAGMMIAADEKIEPEEQEMLRDAMEEMGFSEPYEFSLMKGTLEEYCESVVSKRARAFIMLELASFAHVDNDLAEQERDLLRQIGEIWNFDEISLVRIEEWAYKRVQLAWEAAEIVREVDAFSSKQGRPNK